MGKISKFLEINNLIVVLLLSLMFLNLHGYWYVFAVLPIMCTVVFNEIYRAYDKIFVLFLLFGIWYSIFASPLPTNQYVVFIIVYPMLYLVGKLIGSTETDNGIINILFIMAISMAFMYMRSIATDVSISGFYVEERALAIEGVGGDTEMSATGIYSNLMVLTLFIVALFTKLEYWKKIVFALFAILAFVASVRVGSRSSLVIIIIGVLLFLLLNLRTVIREKFVTVLIVFGLISVLINNIVEHYTDELLVLERFQNDDVETGGNRTELAKNVVYELMEHPMGGLKDMPYAHNLWLDTARVAGVVPLIFLVIITIYYICSLWDTYKQDRYNADYRGIIVMIGLVVLIYMNTEPILEGAAVLFAFFVVLLGVMQGVNKYRVNNA